ncbi:regulatory LuxR family protein [Actinocorallia herbida]|uniref:Regulatory LuxR family protein n=1 Tax=Actinocorallia herbida TaxID=58109 RepID=A0A3N1D2I9_9ACTN|nr:LuxR family transcriptional regulator [Actinocorallia herbida]ROO87745.1 regulatory LuxR family protein [Actinocorallia herbida]
MIPRSQMVGRIEDVRRLCEIFSGGAGRNPGLHVIGTAGVGKSALLDAVAETLTAAGTRVLRADGVEFEADIAYAGLHQLLLPVLDLVKDLAPAHRAVLLTALGFQTGPSPERLHLVNATLDLLREVAAERPVLLLVDDLPWLDRASAVLLWSVARRLPAGTIGFLAASRTGAESPFGHGGLAEYELRPLDDASANLLISARYPAIAARVRARIVAEAGGNPLALLELPLELSDSQRAAQEELPAILPLSERLKALFHARVTALPEPTRRLLLMAALDGTGDLRALSAAAEKETAGLSALAFAERDRLVRIDAASRRLVFHHPLIRSAAVTASTLTERRAAHLALASVLPDQSEHRAWHLAEAAIDADEKVARLLQDAGHAVLRRGDAVGAVAALTRAAELSPDAVTRGRRLAEAAYIGAEATGDILNSSDLLRRAESTGSETLYTAAAAAYVLTNSDANIDTVYRLLVGAVEGAGPVLDAGDPAVIDLLHTLHLVCWWGGRPELWPPFFAAIDRLRPAPPPVLALAVRSFPDPARTGHSALEHLDAFHDTVRRSSDPMLVVRGATAGVYLDRVGEIQDLLWDLVRVGRDGGLAVRRHLGALMHLCMESFLIGEWAEDQKLVDEALALCAGEYPFFTWYFQFNQLLLHGGRGEADAGNALAEQVIRWATRRGVGSARIFALQAQTLVSLGAGDYEAAYAQAVAITPAGTLAPYTAHALWGVYDLVEAAVATGRDGAAEAHVRTLRELRIDRLSSRYAMLVAGAEGLATPGEAGIAHFERALATPGSDRWAFEAARIRLALGERLGRTPRARTELAAALDCFTRLGAVPWADRARRELRAPGQPRAGSPLTPQELEIARLAASGMTNKQIGERLFLSHRTIGAHLYQIFPKLGITTRAALRDALNALGDTV